MLKKLASSKYKHKKLANLDGTFHRLMAIIFRSNLGNIDVKSVKTENNSSIPANDLNLHSNNSNETFNHSQKKPAKNLKKRKRNSKFHYDEESKKGRCDTPVTSFRIPKNINKRNHVGETKLQEECKKVMNASKIRSLFYNVDLELL